MNGMNLNYHTTWMWFFLVSEWESRDLGSGLFISGPPQLWGPGQSASPLGSPGFLWSWSTSISRLLLSACPWLGAVRRLPPILYVVPFFREAPWWNLGYHRIRSCSHLPSVLKRGARLKDPAVALVSYSFLFISGGSCVVQLAYLAKIPYSVKELGGYKLQKGAHLRHKHMLLLQLRFQVQYWPTQSLPHQPYWYP